jgi:hypothetical protein
VNNHSAVALIPTLSASRYLQQLCKHWSHKMTVSFTADQGTILFPKEERSESFAADATVTLQAREEALEVRVNASADRQLETIKAVVASHLDRFAFREAPLALDWR